MDYGWKYWGPKAHRSKLTANIVCGNVCHFFCSAFSSILVLPCLLSCPRIGRLFTRLSDSQQFSVHLSRKSVLYRIWKCDLARFLDLPGCFWNLKNIFRENFINSQPVTVSDLKPAKRGMDDWNVINTVWSGWPGSYHVSACCVLL